MSTLVHHLTDAEYRETTTDRTDDGFGALETPSGNLPLESLDLAIRTTGLAGDVELAQGFRNPYPEPLEATYIFPLPDRAAVTAMRMEADDRTIEGVLKERGEARAEYEQAIAGGRRAAITEEERPDVFTMRVGNILPGERVTVRLRLALELAYEDGVASLRFPLVVAPRYIPGEPTSGDVGTGVVPDTDAVPDASRITPPVLLPGCPNPITLSISADVDPAGFPLSDVASSLHPVKVEEGPDGRTQVEVHPGERADRDFVLRLRLAREDAVATSLSVVSDEDGAEGTFALTVLPPNETAQAALRDVVLILDRSGSMTGWKMVAARRAAARIVDTLTSRDRVAVLAFDNVIETPPGLPDGLVEATDRHRYRAVEHLTRMDARGGTRMLEPLLRAASLLGDPGDGGRERTLVLVTDGQVGNDDQILRELADRVRDVRIHTVGVDVAVNSGFLHRLAGLGGGRCELVESEDRLDEAMDAIHRRIGRPVVTDVELGADGLDVIDGSVTPSRLPAIYAGAPLVVRGRCRWTDSVEAGGVTVRGRAAGGADWQQRVAGSVGDSAALAAVWARAHIRDLEDGYVTAAFGSRSELEQRERDIVATSLRFGVLSRFTAYIAVDTRVVQDGQTVRRVTQPVEAPQGWEMPGLGAPRPAARRLMAPPEASGVRPMAATAALDAAALDAAPTVDASATSTARTRRGRRTVGGSWRSAGYRGPGAPSGIGIGPGGPSVPITEPAPLGEVRQEMNAWVRQLREAPAGERERLLEALRDQLTTWIGTLDRAGVDQLVVRPLQELLAALRAPLPTGTPRALELESRWIRALDVVEAFGQPTPGRRVTDRPRTPRRGAFWKRRA